MIKNNYKNILSGGDLRSIGKSNDVVRSIKTQRDFDELFILLYDDDRIIVMRAADAIEKVTKNDAFFLQKHKKKLLNYCTTVINKELKWHIGLMVVRLLLTKAELGFAWHSISEWALEKKNSRIVRVNAIQSLFELTKQNIDLLTDLYIILEKVKKENIPSITARVKLIETQISAAKKNHKKTPLPIM